MSIENYINQLIRLNEMIRRKSSGNNEEIAKKMGISIRTCQRLIRALKTMGAPIEFSKARQTYYYYKEEGRFIICEWIENKQEAKHSNNGKPTYSNK